MMDNGMLFRASLAATPKPAGPPAANFVTINPWGSVLRKSAVLLTVLAADLLSSAAAQAGPLGSVFVIDMENHNLTQPASVTSPNPLKGNPAMPYMNSLMTPGNPNATQTSWAGNYTSVGASVHPSLPNYLWQEAGTNFGVQNDNMPYGPGGVALPVGTQSLSGLLQASGQSWKSYQEDIDLVKDAAGNLTSTVLPQSQWTVPLNNVSGTNAAYTNPYNGSNQYNFATKHDGQLYFPATNGGNDTTTSNPEVSHYAPLQQLQADLNNNTVARYNLITPDQFNDAHSTLTGGFTYLGTHYTGDEASIAQGDNFLSQIVPTIMASQAYQNNGAIVIWWDETEKGDTSSFTLPEILISPLAKGNAYESTVPLNHSSDLKTWEEVFDVFDGFLGQAGDPQVSDLSSLFQPDTIAPEPSSLMFCGIGGLAMILCAHRRRGCRPTIRSNQ
jgi:hypothetical protein